MCKGQIIEKFLCFCAIRVLLSSSIAYVQFMCKVVFIESPDCLGAITYLRAERRLLTLSLACVKTDYRVFSLACVQWPTY